jgi:hypothetical protein
MINTKADRPLWCPTSSPRWISRQKTKPRICPNFRVKVLVKVGAKKNGIPEDSVEFLGAGNEIRTHDFNLGKVALYH